MHISATFLRPTFPSHYGSPTYHDKGIASSHIDARTILGDPAWLTKKRLYDYTYISTALHNEMLAPVLNTSQCAMQRIASLHGASLAMSHSDLRRHPATFIWDTDDRRRAGAELTELAFDSLAGLERITGSLTLSIVMHGTLRPDQNWTRHDLLKKLSIWTGDSIYHDSDLKQAWSDVVDIIVDRIAVPWQHGYDQRLKKVVSSSSATQDPDDVTPLSSQPLEQWDTFADRLPFGETSRGNTPARLKHTSSNVYPSTPTPSPKKSRLHGSHSQSASRIPSSSQHSRVTRFDVSLFSEPFLDALLAVGWDPEVEANLGPLSVLYQTLKEDDSTQWPAAFARILKLPGFLVLDLFKAAQRGATL
ncbi:hypothetical protein SISNIDRAFT_463484 [Sistotremastrum niveocremeum HHB9708]|uniref:Uncharacterized protein n=1 Tax=Sistotremastrum niveocremeum HHB9708 TaxID=1314777 RepID=A0A164Y9U4_9AGAM|nr:hypothetical protein SISNIDRAFT_463484 [Sistotremastrum niveocremeum HHB9708]